MKRKRTSIKNGLYILHDDEFLSSKRLHFGKQENNRTDSRGIKIALYISLGIILNSKIDFSRIIDTMNFFLRGDYVLENRKIIVYISSDITYDSKIGIDFFQNYRLRMSILHDEFLSSKRLHFEKQENNRTDSSDVLRTDCIFLWILCTILK